MIECYIADIALVDSIGYTVKEIGQYPIQSLLRLMLKLGLVCFLVITVYSYLGVLVIPLTCRLVQN